MINHVGDSQTDRERDPTTEFRPVRGLRKRPWHCLPEGRAALVETLREALPMLAAIRAAALRAPTGDARLGPTAAELARILHRILAAIGEPDGLPARPWPRLAWNVEDLRRLAIHVHRVRGALGEALLPHGWLGARFLVASPAVRWTERGDRAIGLVRILLDDVWYALDLDEMYGASPFGAGPRIPDFVPPPGEATP